MRTTMVPRLVAIVMSRVPDRGSPLAGGAEALPVAAGVPFLPPPDVATRKITTPRIATTPAAAPMMAPRLRRRLARAARSAISRSRRARAAARWRSLVGLTVLYLPDRRWSGLGRGRRRGCGRRGGGRVGRRGGAYGERLD